MALAGMIINQPVANHPVAFGMDDDDFVMISWNGIDAKIAKSDFVTALLGTSARAFQIGLTVPGTVSNGERLLIYPMPNQVQLVSGSAVTLTPATATSVFTLAYKRGVITTTIGTFTFFANGASAVVSMGSPPMLFPGDVLILTAPATADGTLADIGFSILGVKQ